MYEVIRGTRTIKGVEITTWKREILSLCSVEVEAGTNGPCGGDRGHGGRTYIRIKSLDDGDGEIKIAKDGYGNVASIEVELCGDMELETAYKTSQFISKVLKDGQDGVDYE